MGFLADTPKPPYYAVIFSSIKGESEHTDSGAFRRRKRSWMR
ncbi:hypothetical protein BUN12_1477 [Bacillus amyloliquefaciens]|jgi:hypothetical protein|nr:hypothetical protein BAMTA208_12135 [Bacillus amyloliquefaciens TA208]ARW39531.1 hypothetical protein S101267_02444 [Bacillus amyloliquefaciens]AZV89737.1 hypothetical protein BUN12_1477 [Bacillus amyloliquefaciens]OCB93939.1 hypothetical protein SRCM101294_03304 [Bacillus amyloliquefaciens]